MHGLLFEVYYKNKVKVAMKYIEVYNQAMAFKKYNL